MFFRSQIKANQLRKRMLVLECDAQRLLMQERWHHLRGHLGIGKRSGDSGSGPWYHLATLAAPVGAFFLTRWFRRGNGEVNPQKRSSTGDYWSLLGAVFDWVGRFNRS